MLTLLFVSRCACELSIYPFVRRGRTIMNVDNVQFYIHDTDTTNTGKYYVDFETKTVYSETPLFQTYFDYSNTITLTAFRTDQNGPAKADGSLDSFVQKRITIEATPAVYTFYITSEDGSITSEDANSLKIPKGQSRWNVYISDKGAKDENLTRLYIESGFAPKIVVSNSSLDVTLVETAEDHWVIETWTDQSKNPVSSVIHMELFTWNVLLSPVSMTFSMTTQVFRDEEYLEVADLPNEWVDISPVSLSPNSAVFTYKGDLYMTDDAYTTWRKLGMNYTETDGGDNPQKVTGVTDCTFSSLVFAIVMNNMVYWRNFFVEDTFSPVVGFPTNAQDVKLYSRLFDNIPRNQNTSEKYNCGAPVYGSFKNTTGYYVFRYNGTLDMLFVDEGETKITEIVYVGALNCIDICVALVQRGGKSELLKVNFFTRTLEPAHAFTDVVQRLIVNPLTESVVAFSGKKVMISYDGGYNYLEIGQMKGTSVRSFAFRHTTDEVYVVDDQMNLYVVFSELQTMQCIESYTGLDCFVAVSADDCVYLMTRAVAGMKVNAVPIDSYIKSFVYDDFAGQTGPLLTVSRASYPNFDVSVKGYPNTYFTGLSIFGAGEECRYEYHQAKCRELIAGQFFKNSVTITGTLTESATEYSFTTKTVFSTDDVGMTLIFHELSLVTRIKTVALPGGADQPYTLTLEVITNNPSTPIEETEQTYSTRLIDTRDALVRSEIDVTIDATKTVYGYKITCESPDFDLSDQKVGMMLATADNSLQLVITAFDDADTAYAATITGTVTAGQQNMVFQPPPSDTKFKVDAVRKRPWSLQFSNCNGDLVSAGSADYHQLLYITKLDPNSPVEIALDMPSEGVTTTRYTNPDVLTTYMRSTSEWTNFTYYLAEPSEWEPFTKSVSAFCGGSPKCKYLSVLGLTGECLANQRLRIYDDVVRDYRKLGVNYRPPSDLGNNIATSPNAYNRDPQVSKMDKDFTKISREEYLTVPNMCKDAATKAQCHCERADLELMEVDKSDCLDTVGEFVFLSGWEPRIAIEEYVNGEWIVIDENPTVEVMDVNGRTSFCVNQDCATKDSPVLTFSNGQTIYLRGIELFHLKFTVVGECRYVAYQTAYVVNAPMLRYELYLCQSMTAIVIGLLLAILFCCSSQSEREMYGSGASG